MRKFPYMEVIRGKQNKIQSTLCDSNFAEPSKIVRITKSSNYTSFYTTLLFTFFISEQLQLIESAKLRATRALVRYVPRALRALVPFLLSCPTCSRASRASCLTCSRALRAPCLTCSRALRA